MIEKFAKNSDIKMIVEEKQIAPSQFKSFLAKKGIFSLVNNSAILAQQTYPIFLGSNDIKNLQDIMQSSINYKKSSLMLLNPIETYESLEEFIDELSDSFQESKSNDSKYSVENLHKDSQGNLKLKISYIKRLKGKNELINTKVKEINITVIPLENEKKVKIDIRQNDNSDIKEIGLFMDEINRQYKLFEVEKITLDKLTNENKIALFDELIGCNYSKWSLDDISGINVQKSKGKSKEVETESDFLEYNEVLEGDEILEKDLTLEEEESFDDAELVEDVSLDDELKGINTAVFNGNSIRDTGIVKKFEAQGFYFTSIKLMYSCKHSSKSFVININFKGSDDVKIEIVKNYEKEDQKDIVVIFTVDEQEEIIEEFQKNVYKIYKNLLNKQKGLLKQSKQLA